MIEYKFKGFGIWKFGNLNSFEFENDSQKVGKNNIYLRNIFESDLKSREIWNLKNIRKRIKALNSLVARK